jgi:antitoxin VapB
MVSIKGSDIVEIAKIFWSGRSQAVRLPKDFRFDTDRVRVRRKGSTVILEPIPRNWDWLDKIAGTLDDDFVQATEEPMPEQDRPDLDIFE